MFLQLCSAAGLCRRPKGRKSRLEARKDRILWQGQGPLPLEHMCRDTPEGPLDLPLHPAAERFWRAQGYLR